MIVEIRAYPRLHITLIGMNSNGYRINGGIGLAIKDPPITIRVEKSNSFKFRDDRNGYFSANQIARLADTINCVAESQKLRWNIDVLLNGGIWSNSGFGSGTIVRLACLEALHLLNEISFTENSLVSLSGRGGTSGIGTRTYFHGGFVLDIGHKPYNSAGPSSLRENLPEQSLLVDAGFCPEWEIGICLATDIKKMSQEEELAFFDSSVPIDSVAVYETLYHVLYGVYASLKENDFTTFCNSIKNIQQCTWKHLERDLYGESLLKYERELYECGANAVGMSSLGPLLFFVSEDNSKVIEKLETRFPSIARILLNTSVANEGRKIMI